MGTRSIAFVLCSLLTLFANVSSSHADQNKVACDRDNSRFDLQTNINVSNEDAERWTFLQDELDTIVRSKADAPTECQLNIKITILQEFPSFNNNQAPTNQDQSFHIRYHKGDVRFDTVEITSRSSIGALYGVYEILERLGVRYYSTEITVIPDKLDWSLIPEDKSVTPLMPLRGTWTFGQNLDRRFLLWAGRNRLNLIGGEFADGDAYRRIFGIFNWSGGHNVISNLTPTDKTVEGKLLLKEHPEWFGGKAGSSHIAYGSDTYLNPCFGDTGYINYFTDALIGEILTGLYKHSKYINIWPSDQISITVPDGCVHAEGSTSARDDFIFFVNEVSRTIQNDTRLAGIHDRPYILGISYQGNYKLSDTNLLLDASEKTRYLHVFYQDLRSHRSGFFDPASDINRQLAVGLEETVKHHKLQQFGIVEYHGFSVFQGMYLGAPEQYSNDIREYARKGSIMYAYMHPSLQAGPSEVLLNRTISRTLFGDDSPSSILEDFQKNFLGSDLAVFDAFELYEKVLHNRTEFFGSNISLATALFYDVYWDPPLLMASEAKYITDTYINGGVSTLPKYRLAWPNYENVVLPSLREAIKMLDAAEFSLKKIATSDHKHEIKTLLYEIERSNIIHKILIQIYDIRQIQNNSRQCKEKIHNLDTLIENVSSYPWAKYVSDFDPRRLYLISMRNLSKKLSAKYCAD